MTLTAARAGAIASAFHAAGGGIALGSTDIGQGFGNPLTTPGVTTTTGSTLIVLAVQGNGALISTVTDSKSNLYTQLDTEATAFGTSSSFWYCSNIVGGSAHTVQATFSGNCNGTLLVAELTGAAASSLDQSAAWRFATSVPLLTNTTGTTTQAAEMAVAAYSVFTNTGVDSLTWNGGYSEAVSFLNAGIGNPGAIGYKVLSATGNQQGSITPTIATNSEGIVATFKAT